MQISGLLSRPSMGSLLVGKKAVKNKHCVTVGWLVSLSNHDPTIFFLIAHSPPLSRHAEFISASVPVCVQDLQMWHSYKGSDTRSSANLPFNLHAKLYLFYYQTENAVHHKQGN